MELYEKYKTLFSNYGLTTSLRKAHFMAQIDHESGLKPISENLNYSAEGLLKTFKKYFTPEQAKEFARQPEKIANRVYANRMGNGDECSGDGWKYRGKGYIQITGYNNYKALTDYTGIDYINNPELLLTEADSLISALWYWKVNNINTFADRDDIVGVTKKINGGTNGLEDRKSKLKKWKKKLNI